MKKTITDWVYCVNLTVKLQKCILHFEVNTIKLIYPSFSYYCNDANSYFVFVYKYSMIEDYTTTILKQTDPARKTFIFLSLINHKQINWSGNIRFSFSFLFSLNFSTVTSVFWRRGNANNHYTWTDKFWPLGTHNTYMFGCNTIIIRNTDL